MIKVVSDGLWGELKKLAAKRGNKVAAIAFVSSDDALSFGEGDILVTDASNRAISSRNTAASVLRRAFERGTEIYSLPDLHAKVMVFDRIAVIGSANSSRTSAEDLIEAAVITDTPSVVSSARGFIEDLTKMAVRVNERFIRRISAIKVKEGPGGGRRGKKRRKVKIRDHRTWLVSVAPLDEDRYRDEADLIKEGMVEAKKERKNRHSSVTWIRMTGNSRFRKTARKGDSVIQIQTDESRKKVLEVYPHSAILHRQNEPRCTRFYIEESRSVSQQTIAWASFKKLIRSAGLSWVPTTGCARELREEQGSAIHLWWRKFT